MERLQRKLEFAKHKEPPTPLPLGSEILEDTLYLYGVDYMSTFDIKAYLERYTLSGSDKDILEVKWINDSSCTINFENAELAAKALKEQALTSSMQEQQHENLQLHIGQVVVDGSTGEVDPRNFDPLLGWREALGY